MSTVVINGVEARFQDLDLEERKELYLEESERFKYDIIEDDTLRIYIIRDIWISEEIVEYFFEIAWERKEIAHIRDIVEHPRFKMDEKNRKLLADSEYDELRMLAVNDEGADQSFLEKMLKAEIEGKNSLKVIEAIYYNENLKKDKKTKKLLFSSKFNRIRLIPVRDKESSAELLREMLKAELKGENDDLIVQEIVFRKNFKMDEESRKLLSKSKISGIRKKVARDKESSVELLREMLRAELEGENNPEVIDAILSNYNFEMDKASIELLAKSKDARYRTIAVKEDNKSKDARYRTIAVKEDKLSVESLKEMLKAELEGENNPEVIDAILSNYNFEMDEASIKLLAKSKDAKYREIAINYEGATIEFLEDMYLEECEESLLNMIDLNLRKKKIMQKREIVKALEESKNLENLSVVEIIKILL